MYECITKVSFDEGLGILTGMANKTFTNCTSEVDVISEQNSILLGVPANGFVFLMLSYTYIVYRLDSQVCIRFGFVGPLFIAKLVEKTMKILLRTMKLKFMGSIPWCCRPFYR